jgi:hypothetical protein
LQLPKQLRQSKQPAMQPPLSDLLSIAKRRKPPTTRGWPQPTYRQPFRVWWWNLCPGRKVHIKNNSQNIIAKQDYVLEIAIDYMVHYWKGRRRIPWEMMLQPSTVSSSRPSYMLTCSFVIVKKKETLWPTRKTLIPFQRHPWTPTHQTSPRWTQIQCQAFPWMCILCSKSLWKHDMQ